MTLTGVTAFLAGLEQMRLATEQRGHLVVVTLDFGSADAPGPHDVGTDPPNDFPRVPPHWLHLHQNIVLPEGEGRRSELGENWLKWSRQHPKWTAAENPARLWVAHARSLLLTARAA